MTIFIIVSAIFFALSLCFGLKFAEVALKISVSSALGAGVWFLYGMASGESSLFVWLGSTIVFLVLIELFMGD